MPDTRRCALLAATFCALLVASTAAQARCIADFDGGARVVAVSGSGTGGTGLRGDEGSGTGGTGVFGTVTGFGSICVNGLEIEFDDATAIDRDGREITVEALRVGQVVHLTTEQAPEGLRASHISVETALGGPVERIDRDRGEIRVMGQTVLIALRAHVFEGRGGLDAMTTGERVSVSGLRRPDGVVVATRVDPRPRDEPDVVTGLAFVAGLRTVHVGGLRAELERTASESVAGRIRLWGVFDAEAAVLESAQARPAAIEPGRGGLLSLEGFAVRAEDALLVEGIEIDPAALPDEWRSVREGDRLWLRGRVASDGRLRADWVHRGGPDREARGPGQGAGQRGDHEEPADREARADPRAERALLADRPERGGRPDGPVRPERSARPERPERVERPARPGGGSRPGRP